jgi:chemotaxis family two-component system sensor kinase Cph1
VTEVPSVFGCDECSGGSRWRGRTVGHGSLVAEVCWRPRDGVATGDFCEVVPRADGTVGMVVADAVGWGPRAARLAGLWAGVARAELGAGRPPEEVLAALDATVAVRGPDSFATAVCVVIDPASGIVEVSNAGHPSPVVAGGGEVRQISIPRDPALGVGAAHHVGSFALAADEVLYVVTDGMIERRDLPLTRSWHVLIEAAGWLTAGRARASDLALVLTDRLGEPDDDAQAVSVRVAAGSPTPASGSGLRRPPPPQIPQGHP